MIFWNGIRSVIWIPVLFLGLVILSPGKCDARDLVYVALGNSYTVGTGVDPNDAWPFQLATRLQERGFRVTETHNLAVAGAGIQSVIDEQLPQTIKVRPDFITLQIGVNDWVRSTGARRFIHKVNRLLDELLSLDSPAPKILIVSLPDFSCGPSVKRFGFGKSASNGMKRFNRMLNDQSIVHSTGFADIYELSQMSCGRSDDFSGDGLHPSRKQYEEWVEVILPEAEKILNQTEN